jgi:hypothetical protein
MSGQSHLLNAFDSFRSRLDFLQACSRSKDAIQSYAHRESIGFVLFWLINNLYCPDNARRGTTRMIEVSQIATLDKF